MHSWWQAETSEGTVKGEAGKSTKRVRLRAMMRGQKGDKEKAYPGGCCGKGPSGQKAAVSTEDGPPDPGRPVEKASPPHSPAGLRDTHTFPSGSFINV